MPTFESKTKMNCRVRTQHDAIWWQLKFVFTNTPFEGCSPTRGLPLCRHSVCANADVSSVAEIFSVQCSKLVALKGKCLSRGRCVFPRNLVALLTETFTIELANWIATLDSDPTPPEAEWHSDWLVVLDSRGCPCQRMTQLPEVEKVHKIGL